MRLTERQAWEELALDAGRERTRRARGTWEYNFTYNGLCGGITQLPISETVARRMRNRIRQALRVKRNKDGMRPTYLWPLTASGFKRRAAWARKQAAAAGRAR